MLNLIKPTYNFFNVHKTHYLQRLKSTAQDNFIWQLTPIQEQGIENAYKDYERLFNLNNLNLLQKYHFFSDTEKENYKSLYNYSLAYFRNFKKELTYIDGTKIGDCPFCEHGKPNTLDHIIPKAEFPEFCDNLLNLVPMCSNCNSHKGKEYLDSNNEILFINLYKDQIPDVQYLILEINKENGEFDIEFKLETSLISDLTIRQKLLNTYIKLQLFDFYKELSFKRISTFTQQLKNLKTTHTQSEIKDIIKSEYYLKNFWEHVLIRGIVDNQEYYDFLFNN